MEVLLMFEEEGPGVIPTRIFFLFCRTTLARGWVSPQCRDEGGSERPCQWRVCRHLSVYGKKCSIDFLIVEKKIKPECNAFFKVNEKHKW